MESSITALRKSILVAFMILFLQLLARGAVLADSYYPNSGVDVTDDARTTAKGHSQLMLNYEWDEMSDFPSFGVPVFAFKYGVTDRLDVGIQFPYSYNIDSNSKIAGLDDFEFGFKYMLTPLKEKHILVSAILSAKPATAVKNDLLGNGVTDYAAHLAATYENARWTNTLNFGYNAWGAIPDVPRFMTPFYRYEIQYQCSRSFQLGAEVYGQQSPNTDFYGSPLQTTLKATVQMGKGFSLDIGLAKGLNGDSPVRRYLIALTRDL
jgi:hypothetical protein